MSEQESIVTLELSKYRGLAEVVREVRTKDRSGESGSGVVFPQAGTEYDGKTILRCKKTIDSGYYLMVLEDGSMFYIFDDVGLE